MTGYRIALFLHLCALIAATGATALAGLAMRRVRDARVGGEALRWLGLAKSAAHVFPAAIVTLLATGAYMVHSAWSWSTPWVDAGLAGVAFLGVVGDRVEGGRARRIAQALAVDPSAPIEGLTAALVRDPVWWTAAAVDPMVALGVVFAMVTKPSYAGAFGALAGFAAIGAAGAVPLWRRPAPEAESQPAA